ncbi:MAG TPA: aldehyde ferredoxin oxidoreductase N-terminal domain-containing protein [Syntrophobacteraceae bacterium]|nr:aldehyde ferredoxin oxidoreductase N-terminal domain-containing protein [Syntrophobacteraceae bacterium]
MIREDFRVLVVDLAAGRGSIVRMEGVDAVAGGSGLAALLFHKYGLPDRPWNDPEQPLIFAIGPLTGYFPLMSKTVCAFKSPYHDQYAESHAGGRSALSLRFADLDALVIRGRATELSCLSVGSRHLEVKDVHFLRGMDLLRTGKMLRRMYPGAGHRSIFRIGPAGENLSAMACINVDTYRHFGRLGCGAVMGAKNLKGIVILGDGSFPLPPGKDYPRLFAEVYGKITDTDMMEKYHNYGTPVNMAVLNGIRALPIRNLQKTSDPDMEGISGETFARDTLLRNAACAGCPVGCVHLGFVRERFMGENRYLYRQVSYDHEPIFAVGAMLQITNAFSVLSLLEAVEREGLDVMSAGVALAWATEALEKEILSVRETLVPLKFGDEGSYRQAFHHLGAGSNDFYRLLAQGTLKAARAYGGADFACVLGQEMAGYATGEVFFVSQALGLRHSHLDAGGYSYDQKNQAPDVEGAVRFLVRDEQARVLLTSMVGCLFARGIYGDEVLSDCLRSLGRTLLADNLGRVSRRVQQLRWKIRLGTGFDPRTVTIPRRFYEVETWRGRIDGTYLDALKDAYARAVLELAHGGAD